MAKEPILPQKVLVLINGTPIDNDVVKVACRMTAKTLGDVYAIYVIELKRTLPLEAEVEPEIQKGEDVLDHVDLIILGINYEKPFGEFSLGNTVPYVLKYAPCSVLIYREPIPIEQVKEA